MPELPEVEVTRIGLADRLQGARVRAVHVGKPLRWPLGVAPRALHDLAIGPLSRRGKYIWMPLEGGARRGGLLWHLGMSGSLALHEREAPPRGVHDHFELASTAGVLRLTDPRRFGAGTQNNRDFAPSPVSRPESKLRLHHAPRVPTVVRVWPAVSFMPLQAFDELQRLHHPATKAGCHRTSTRIPGTSHPD